jgi:acyl-CoA synthetase (AMP-forming)/AMP-acid ligase II
VITMAAGEVWDRAPNVIGRPLIGVGSAMLDADDRPVAHGEVGELCFRASSVTAGYWKLPDATAQMLRNGWLHTGDLGHTENDGVPYFVDRKKDMVKSDGENVYSVEVEQVLLGHPCVAECAIIGVPDKRWGEAVKAVVALRGEVSVEDLNAWCLARLAPFKRSRWYEFVPMLPRNAMAKVLKGDLRVGHDPATAVRIPERRG